MAEEALPADNDRGPMLLAITWTTAAVATMIVILRIYSRTVFQHTMGRDDAAIIAALLSTLLGQVWITLQVHDGYGRHVYYLSNHQILQSTKWTTVFEIQNAIGVYFVKVSVCLFILRMIAVTHEAMRRVLLGTIALLTLLMLGNVSVICFQCVPFEAVWNPAISGRCMTGSDADKLAKAFNAFGVATDFICVILSILVLRGLQMSKYTKIELMILMALGTFTGACSLVKTTLIDFRSEDPTWHLVTAEIWADVEENLGIAIASLPACRRLFIMGLSSTRKSSYLTRFAPPNIHNTTVSRRIISSDQHDNDADNLIPMSDIQVTNSLEVQYATRTPSFHEIERGYVMPGVWKNSASASQMAIEGI
ncbi:hypothetical protein JMJ35_005366 [Cladonia borealis]|uniref:Rhodopsin domain-containing protein n=1 Tax=Cladonia borealis TaxID=184061 RepID=A0AA39QZU0_9LECA|nr:hypothetical protein JMJ35_005366 [Cladonia borealis]